MLVALLAAAFVVDVNAHQPTDGPIGYTFAQDVQSRAGPSGPFAMWAFVDAKAESKLVGEWRSFYGVDSVAVIPANMLEAYLDGERVDAILYREEGELRSQGTIHVSIGARDCISCHPGERLAIVWTRGETNTTVMQQLSRSGVWHFTGPWTATSASPVDFRSYVVDVGIGARSLAWSIAMSAMAATFLGIQRLSNEGNRVIEFRLRDEDHTAASLLTISAALRLAQRHMKWSAGMGVLAGAAATLFIYRTVEPTVSVAVHQSSNQLIVWLGLLVTALATALGALSIWRRDSESLQAAASEVAIATRRIRRGEEPVPSLEP